MVVKDIRQAQSKEKTKVQVYLPTPTEKQVMFVDSDKKRIIVRAGRRGGKTVGAAIKAVKAFLAGKRVLYAAPTSEQVGAFWFEVKNALDPLIRLGVYKKNESENFIERPGTEQRIKGKTAWNPDMMRGDYCDLLILDEWQLMHEDTWGVVAAPMLADHDGDAIFIYTPPSLSSRLKGSESHAMDKRHAAKMFKEFEEDPTCLAIHFTSQDNPHVSSVALDRLRKDMTSLAYQQEILAMDIDIVPGALWTLEILNRYRVSQYPPLIRVIVGVDPPGGATECGIIACGRGRDGHYYVINDGSLRSSPDVWADTAINVYDKEKADKMVAEVNFGGDMVESIIKKTAKTLNKTVNYQSVRASRGKAVRAEPIAAAYEQGRVHHVGDFPFLEEELTSWVPGDKESPNRLDACVWSLSELMDGVGGGKPRSKRSGRF
ncbi:hypothetical protein LCGC14_1267180 [marine sediment metagenome]|uniref:Terminase large subunit gp17-like C-terminal domain-containing protein n=1 Tax=marine sediment metagenome TaxID=412755 RepID=A0A0F9LK06_9ZZZZ